MKVSISMITYNHEKYIKQAVESVLMQNCNFDYEIVIGDDASTDNTRNELLKLKKSYPDKIKLLLQEKNVGMLTNITETLKKCKGSYIAKLEGDDYWTDPNKLQKQVDFLDANPEYVISYTDYTQLIDNTGKFEKKENLYHKEELGIDDLLEHNYITTLTCVFRNNLFDKLPKEFFRLKVGDWPLHMLNAQHGKIKYHKGWNTAVYRIHDGGVWSGQQKITKHLAYAEVYEFFKQILSKQYNQKIKQKIIEHYYSAASIYIQQGKKEDADKVISKIKNESSVFSLKYLKIKLKYLLNK